MPAAGPAEPHTYSRAMLSGSDFLRWSTAPMRNGVVATAANAAIELPCLRIADAALRRRTAVADDDDDDDALDEAAATAASWVGKHLLPVRQDSTPTVDTRRWYGCRTAPTTGDEDSAAELRGVDEAKLGCCRRGDEPDDPADDGGELSEDGSESADITHWMLWRRGHVIFTSLQRAGSAYDKIKCC